MLYGVLGIIHLILFIIAAVEIVTGGKPVVEKLLWLLIIFFLPLIGLVLYYLIGRGK